MSSDWFTIAVSQHGSAAKVLIAKLQKLGHVGILPIGIENNKHGIYDILKFHQNEVSRYLRHELDYVLTIREEPKALIDLKSEGQGYANFSFEFDSVYEAQRRARTGIPTYFATVDMKTKSCGLIDVMDIPTHTIYCPRPERCFDILEKCPDAIVVPRRVNLQYASGTPYILVSKKNPDIVDIDNLYGMLVPPPITIDCSGQAHFDFGGASA